jgi:hypothetical protein
MALHNTSLPDGHSGGDSARWPDGPVALHTFRAIGPMALHSASPHHSSGDLGIAGARAGHQRHRFVGIGSIVARRSDNRTCRTDSNKRLLRWSAHAARERRALARWCALTIGGIVGRPRCDARAAQATLRCGGPETCLPGPRASACVDQEHAPLRQGGCAHLLGAVGRNAEGRDGGIPGNSTLNSREFNVFQGVARRHRPVAALALEVIARHRRLTGDAMLRAEGKRDVTGTLLYCHSR